MAGKSGIKIKKSRRGTLRKKAGVKKGQKLTLAKIRQMKKSKSPAVRKKAVFAENAKTKFGKKGKKR